MASTMSESRDSRSSPLQRCEDVSACGWGCCWGGGDGEDVEKRGERWGRRTTDQRQGDQASVSPSDEKSVSGKPRYRWLGTLPGVGSLFCGRRTAS